MHSSQAFEQILCEQVIAIDGPAGSGKTTTARGVAAALSLRHIDTGAMYRAVTWKALTTGIDPGDEGRVGEIASTLRIEFSAGTSKTQDVRVDGTDVTDAIRSAEVTRNVSLVSSYASVRKAMVRLQRRLASGGGAVLEGRDIGSVVLPDAEVKVFLTASVEERARRRFLEVERSGAQGGMTFEEMRTEIERRDRLDSSREISPLKVPVGAHVVDTTRLSIDEQVGRIVDLARETAAFLSSPPLASKEEKLHARRRRTYRYSCLAIRGLSRLLFGLRVVRRQRRKRSENYIFACNHRSNADPPIVGATLEREVYFMAKENLFRSRWLSGLISYYNAISTRRDSFDRNAFQRAEEVLRGGGSLLIFPEGTRIRGADLGRAKPGVGYLALQTGVPVLPVYADGTQNLRRCLFRRDRLVVVQGNPVRIQSRETAAPTAENCREFGDMIMAAIAALRDEVDSIGG